MGDLVRFTDNPWHHFKRLGGLEGLRRYYMTPLEKRAKEHPSSPLSPSDGEYEPVGEVVQAIHELERVAREVPVFIAAGNKKDYLNVFCLAKGVHVVGGLNPDGNRWHGSEHHPTGSALHPFITDWEKAVLNVRSRGGESYSTEAGTSYATPFMLTQHVLKQAKHNWHPREFHEQLSTNPDNAVPNNPAPIKKRAGEKDRQQFTNFIWMFLQNHLFKM